MFMNNERLNIFETSGAEQNVKLFVVDLFESLDELGELVWGHSSVHWVNELLKFKLL